LLHLSHLRRALRGDAQQQLLVDLAGDGPRAGGRRHLPAPAEVRHAVAGRAAGDRPRRRAVGRRPRAARPRRRGGRMTDGLVTADHLSKWYGQVIGANDVSVSVPHGITGLLGPNGAGKSTFMKLITGQLKP